MKLLHLSDTHYGMWTFKGASAPESTHVFEDKVTGRPLPAALRDILLRCDRCNDPTAVIVSGDLGWSGSPEDYGFALEFLNGLRSKWTKATFVINAGNHDLTLVPGPDDVRQNAFIDMLRSFYGKAFARTFPFLTKCEPSDRRNFLAGFHHLPGELLVVSINTGASINKSGDRIVVRPELLDKIEAHLLSINPSASTLRIFVLHHHLFPFAEPRAGHTVDPRTVWDTPDTTIVANSARLQTWLAKNRFLIVLHGHRHRFHGRQDILWKAESDHQT